MVAPFQGKTHQGGSDAFLARMEPDGRLAWFMYLGGGWMMDRLGTRRGFAITMATVLFAVATSIALPVLAMTVTTMI